MKHTLLISAGALVVLASCASQSAQTATEKAVSQTRAGLADAAMTPLEDLNLRREDIPPVLTDISNPYDVPADISCADISASVDALNAVLGPDFDATKEEDDSTLSDKAAGTASDSLLKVVASEAGGLIPYRGWVRQLSGAKRHQAKIKRAINKGTHRRTYLKAIGAMKSCDGAASPDFEALVEEQRVEFRGDVPDGFEQQPETTGELPALEEDPWDLVPDDVDTSGLDPIGERHDAETQPAQPRTPSAAPTWSYPIED
ncbi:MAG: hypothetical protein WA989_09140 [Henriciella sp.]|uniref:hypothetical protein n=1 Tax=Henriciella sp. TaxID=1968823 RepID=UPI003C724DC1